MKKIFYLVLFSTILGLYFSSGKSQMAEILSPNSMHAQRMAFLIRKACHLSGNDETTETTLDVNDDTTIQNNARDREECAETIGFMPINKEKVQIFVTALKSATGEIELQYESKTILKCDNNGLITKKDDINFDLWKVTHPAEKEVLHIEPHDTLVQCESVILEKKTETTEDIFSNGDWSLIITPPSTSSASAPAPAVTYKGTLKHEFLVENKITPYDIFIKITCYGDAIILPKETSNQTIEFMDLMLEKGSQDVLQKNGGESGGKKVFYYTKVEDTDCRNKDINNRMTYSIINDDGTTEKEEIGLKVECIFQDSKEYKYEIIKPDETSLYLKPNQKVKVWCKKFKCHSCPDVPSKINCPTGSECTRVTYDKFAVAAVAETYENFQNCYKLKTEECTLIHLNGKIEKSPKAPATCQDNGKYKIGEVEVDSIQCAKKFSIDDNNVTNNEVPNNLKQENIDMLFIEECYNPMGCQCKHIVGPSLGVLAIANKNGSTWLRINSLKFNDAENQWIYNRTSNGVTQLHELDKDRAVKCIAATAAKASKKKVEVLPNKRKTVVFAVNIGLLILIIAIVVPAVIFYVNARVKKRETLKAAKKDKKKDDQTGDKKTEEEKKADKKNEA